MIAELLLVVHDSEIVIVAGAEHALRHYLIVAFPPFDNPDSASARLKSIASYVSRFDEGKSPDQPFFENIR